MSCSLPELTGALGWGACFGKPSNPPLPPCLYMLTSPIYKPGSSLAKTCTRLARASAVTALQ